EEARGHRDDTAERETAIVATGSSAAGSSTAVARTSQEAERRGEIARYGAVEKAPPPPEITPWVPPDPEAIGVSRRQFFNRALGLAHGHRYRRVLRRRVRRLPLADGHRRLRLEGASRQAR
ncbi:MAG: hypothetical protein WKF58_15205, partial [Ilumatobacteraceae bacterium]